MPQIRSIHQDSKKDDGLMEQLLKLVETIGLNPGDLMGGLGTVAGKAGKMLKFPPKFPNPDSVMPPPMSPKFQNEFDLMNKVPTKPPLEHDEVRKMLDLLGKK